MGYTKTELFDEQFSKNATLFKALAHPARIQILKFLAESCTCITGDISEELPLKRTTVNQHIKELREVGLIQGQTEGAKTKYCLNHQAIEDLSETLNLFLDELKSNPSECK